MDAMHSHLGIWKGMIARCENPNNNRYHRYGGRGITVCKRWRMNVEDFIKDMGPRPYDRTLDRINPDGNYEKSNCRWATIEEQQQNRSKQPTPLKLIMREALNGKKLTCKYIRLYGVSITEIKNNFRVSKSVVSGWHKSGILKSILNGTILIGEWQGPKLPKMRKYKKIGSKYKRLYGMTIKEISTLLDIGEESVRERHKKSALLSMLEFKN